MKKLLIKISVIILFLITSAQTNDDIKKLESDIKKAATDIAETLKIEVAIKGKKLTNFFTNNDLKLISENGLREYKFKNKTYEIIKDNEIIQSGSWKINGLLKNQIRLISNSDQKKYYLKKISKKPWIYNYDKRPGSEGAEKEILHIRSSSKFNDIVSKVTFSFEEENSNKLSKNNDEDFKIKKVKKTKTKTVSTQDQKDQKIIKETLEDVPLTVSSKINNKDELREFLINNGMKYISTDGYYRIFSFNEDGKGTFYMDNKKKEMPLIWEVINKNTLKSGHPKIVEQRGWTILKIDFEKKKLYKDLSSINGEKYTFDVTFENSNPSKVESPKTQEAKNETLVDENNKSTLYVKCESIVKKKWDEIKELKDYSISADEQEKRRRKKMEPDINACVEINSKEVDVELIPSELVVKKDGITYIKGNPGAFDTSPLEICDEAAVIWNNCKASYDMSTAPAEIYNDLVEANNVSVYRGEFKDNFPHGSGTLQFKDGTFTYVIFDNGRLKKLTDHKGTKAYQLKKLMEILKTQPMNSYQAKPGYEICRSTWKQLILIRNTHSKNTSSYHKIDGFVETAFELMSGYKGTNAMDTGNCEKLLSLAKK